MHADSIPKSSRHCLILAAGKSTRFKSDLPKVLHELCGKTVIEHVLDKLSTLCLEQTIVVVGHAASQVRQALTGLPLQFVEQREQLGTGHAVITAAERLKNLQGSLLILYGDAPLIRTSSLERLMERREAEDADLALLTAELEDPFGYGRVLTNAEGQVTAIIEEKEASAEQKRISRVNSGSYCFKISALLQALPYLSNQNRTGEYYLTDLIAILNREGGKVIAVSIESAQEAIGINDRIQLAKAATRLRAETNEHWQKEGVTLLDPATTYIDVTVAIGRDTVIYPGVILEKNCRIGSNCRIGAYCHLVEATIEENTQVDHCSVIRDSTVGAATQVGPFAHIRQGSAISDSARIGNFVEVKNSRVGKGSKAAHLAYLGDAEVGNRVNIGAGVITCNYDGFEKHKTIIEDGAFVGSDCQLLAPVTVRKEAYVAAGSTITDEVPARALAIARCRQTNKADWAAKKKK